jgi:hypothetical protein
MRELDLAREMLRTTEPLLQLKAAEPERCVSGGGMKREGCFCLLGWVGRVMALVIVSKRAMLASRRLARVHITTYHHHPSTTNTQNTNTNTNRYFRLEAFITRGVTDAQDLYAYGVKYVGRLRYVSREIGRATHRPTILFSLTHTHTSSPPPPPPPQITSQQGAQAPRAGRHASTRGVGRAALPPPQPPAAGCVLLHWFVTHASVSLSLCVCLSCGPPASSICCSRVRACCLYVCV